MAYVKVMPRLVYQGLVVFMLSGYGLQGQAADLLEVYRFAQANDPTLQVARHGFAGAQEKFPQARAGNLPTVTLNGSNNVTEAKASYNGAASVDRSVSGWNWSLQLTQPIMRPQNVLAYFESEAQVEAAQAQFAQAEQDLILRVAQFYFDVLVAQEAVTSAEAQLRAMEDQGVAAKRGYELGTMSITDSHEARSKAELARAQFIAAQNDLEVKQTELERLTDKPLTQLASLQQAAVVPQPQPADPKAWIAEAKDNNPLVRSQLSSLRAAGYTVTKAKAEHFWTLDFVASYGTNYSTGSAFLPTNFETRVTPATAGIQFSMPIFAGGLNSSRIREALANRDKFAAQLEETRRKAGAEAKLAYIGIVNGLAQTEALLSAVKSGDSSVKGNQAGYKLGIRINSDVLNAQQQLFVSRRDLVKARYDTLMQGLKLKAAAGVLTEADVVTINGMLEH